jgi:predicted 3-demethylubiquinone-9 3-methyltransferase (glyoxalase superfamily)
MTNQQIYPCLWFDGQANTAAELYCEVFGNSKILQENPMVVTFELHGQKFMGLNGGPMYKPNASVSFYVVCESIREVDLTWHKLLDGGSVMMPLAEYPWSARYGWLQDRFGISWQLSFGKMEDVGQKFSPMLMFTNDRAGKAEQAVKFYTSVFDNSNIAGILKYSADDEDIEGMVKHAQFSLGKYVFMAIDSSFPHQFDFSEGISFVVECETQEEIDYYWDKLTGDGGQESMCGWLKDKFGVSWQIIPSILQVLLNDPAKAESVTRAFLQMKKFEIKKLLL